ncbi:AraC family transcriptional regulator [Actinoplanes sp. TBRC 11911]|uniref:AraC family transcriptional regulator n=1 Tax=Actinoplanes sp. TBRC 11911 TaxID=2729386 RepID=UPI00145F8200|nr:AraC family transcriptional regulator [Actinoplanes sp. TBRC 11911]NMO51612.1 AraC family transcriptional regulator [Actinoplanes sp. TBRC 11911]
MYDPFSDALGIIRPRVTSRGFTAGGRWAVRFTPRQQTLSVHVAVRGHCGVLVGDRDPICLDEGDVLLCHGTAPWILASDRAVPPADADDLFALDPAPIVQLGGSEVAGIAGHIQMDVDPILASLGHVTHIRAADPAAAALRYLLGRVLRELGSPAPGSAFAGEKYAQIILVEVLRVALEARDAHPAVGWLRVFADAELRPALVLMHEQPGYPWRLADLAQAVSMSRSAFATRFRVLSGMPPLTYLHHFRIRLAEVALRETDATVATLAARFGYSSESSFSHAFTRTAGVSPRHYRSLHRAAVHGPGHAVGH